MAGNWVFAKRLVIAVVALGLLPYFAASPVSQGGADASHKGPPLSSIALMSRFAREQNLAYGALTQPVAVGFDAGLSIDEQVTPQLVGITAPDKRVNQDFSLAPQNETSIAVNPWSPNMLVAGAHDYRLGAPIGAAFYTSFSEDVSGDRRLAKGHP